MLRYVQALGIHFLSLVSVFVGLGGVFGSSFSPFVFAADALLRSCFSRGVEDFVLLFVVSLWWSSKPSSRASESGFFPR